MPAGVTTDFEERAEPAGRRADGGAVQRGQQGEIVIPVVEAGADARVRVRQARALEQHRHDGGE
jgi:hypothetical protein